MPASNRRLPFRVPLAQGARRCRLHRFTVSLDPAVFEKLHARASANDQPLSWTASDLIERALEDL
jgi:hypothetical protein